jgi:hypothetical protein
MAAYGGGFYLALAPPLIPIQAVCIRAAALGSGLSAPSIDGFAGLFGCI